MDLYVFPFDTCETPRRDGHIAQPVSTFVNVMSCVVLTCFALASKDVYRFTFFLSLLIFELMHTYSHIKHIPGHVQTNIIHGISYIINVSLLVMLIHITRSLPSHLSIGVLVLLVGLDTYAFLNKKTIAFITTQATILGFVLLIFYSKLSYNIQKVIPGIIVCIIVIICLFVNEMYNCKHMMMISNDVPWHVMIEVVGFIFFILVGSAFYK